MPAIPPHDTQVVDLSWDGSAQEAKLTSPITKVVGTGMYAWFDPNAGDDDRDGYPDAKSGYKFPHHEVAADGHPGAANVRAVRNALSRVGQADIPDGDRAAVREHLQHHLDAFNANKSSGGAGGSVLWAAGLMSKRLALRPEIVAVIQAALAAGSTPPVMKPDATSDEPAPGIIPLYGLITPNGSFLSMLFGLGGGGLNVFRAQLDQAVNDPTVSHILIDVDSPGGLVDLVPEAAAEVRAARDVKPVTAIANTEACSAAYWIASQAGDLVMTPSGEVGSVGVYQMHRDVSAAEDQMGIKTTLISAGKYKTEANPYEPLSSDARKAMQDQIDEIYGWFVSDVAAGRGVPEATVRSGFGQGRTLLASGAVDAGMADRVATLEQTLGAIMTAPPSSDPAVPAAKAAALFALLG